MNTFLQTIFYLFFFQFAISLQIFSQDVAIDTTSVFENIKQINVNGNFCSIKIIGHNENTVRFNGIIKVNENKDAYEIKTLQQDQNLDISVIVPENWKSHWGEIELEVPNNIEIKIETLSGGIDVSNLDGGNISIVSKSGHVKIDNYSGIINANTPAGDISLANIKGEIVGQTKTGNVSISNIDGKCNVSTNKGNLVAQKINGELITDAAAGSQDIESVNGKLAVKGTSGEVKISLVKGELNCRLFAGNLKLFQSEGTYTIETSTGNITGSRIKFVASSSFKSTEGNIKVQMNTPADKLAFELESDNSFLRAMGKSKKKKLKIGKGDILITGISTTGSQAYY